jgi:hypothetical protein
MKTEERGVSLVELLVAMTILVLGLMPLLRLTVFALRTGKRANVMSVANNMARGLGEEIRTKAFSEEYNANFSNITARQRYPNNTGTAQSFQTEETFNAGDSRFEVFDDVDDYNNWCRGPQCDCTGVSPAALCDQNAPLETYNGFKYDGTNGFPDYGRFTRQVKVFNISVIPEDSYTRAPYENLSGELISINRYNFEETNPNYSSYTSGVSGKSPLKVIEVTVSYQGGAGIMREDLHVRDVSMSVMPLITEEE